MHSCLADLNDVVLAPIFVCALFFALFGGFLGQDLFRFNFPGFFELYSCQSSSLYPVSFRSLASFCFILLNLGFLGIGSVKFEFFFW